MLILAYADRFWFDLDQFRQWILQAPADGDAPRTVTSRSGNSWMATSPAEYTEAPASLTNTQAGGASVSCGHLFEPVHAI